MTDEEFEAIKKRDEEFCRSLPRGAQIQVEKDCTDLIAEVERLRPFRDIARRLVTAESPDEVFEQIEVLGAMLEDDAAPTNEIVASRTTVVHAGGIVTTEITLTEAARRSLTFDVGRDEG